MFHFCEQTTASFTCSNQLLNKWSETDGVLSKTLSTKGKPQSINILHVLKNVPKMRHGNKREQRKSDDPQQSLYK